MKFRKYLYYSLIFSIAVHLAFALYSMHVRIMNVVQRVRPPVFFKVKTAQALVTPASSSDEMKPAPAGSARPAQPAPARTQNDIARFVKERQDQLEKEPVFSHEEMAVRIPDIAQKTPEPEFPSTVTPAGRPSRTLRKTLVPAITVRDSPATVTAAAASPGADVPELFKERMPGFTPSAVSNAAYRVASGDRYRGDHPFRPLVGRRSSVGDLKEYLVSRLLTYQDPKTGERYFQMIIRTGKDATGLKARPKEIVFLVDCSNSIQKERLAGFQKGLMTALRRLNPGDRFNLVAFRDGIVRFREKSVELSPANIRLADKFLQKLVVGKRTDTYNALYKAIDVRTPFSPSYVMILSDGRPTQGIVDSGKLIRQISQANDGRVSIFAFSGGVWVNRYLLDFIAYKNRGWSEYSSREHLIGESFTKMYEKIRNPILVNTRFHVSGVKDTEVFPKMLPDLFRDAEFTLYGRYEAGDPLVLQLLGDMEGKTHEFLVEVNWDEAEAGNETIARNWAFNKIYYLIGLLQNEQDSSQSLQTIRDLSTRFKIQTPYLKFE